jgi:hypothetical protein
MPRSLAGGGLADVLRRARWTEGDAAAVLAALDASQLSVYAFATREDLDADRLYRWRARLSWPRRRRLPAFVEIQPAATSPIEVLLRSGLVLRVPGGFDEGTLRRLVSALDQGREC